MIALIHWSRDIRIEQNFTTIWARYFFSKDNKADKIPNEFKYLSLKIDFQDDTFAVIISAKFRVCTHKSIVRTTKLYNYQNRTLYKGHEKTNGKSQELDSLLFNPIIKFVSFNVIWKITRSDF